MKSKYSVFLLIASLTFLSCEKEGNEHDHHDHDHTTVTGIGDLSIRFQHYFGQNPIGLDTVVYTNPAGGTLTLSNFSYYVSNITLTGMDGTTTVIPESYYLIRAASDSSHHILLPNLAGKHYAAISFILGVDSARNVSGNQTGALDPGLGHFWNWTEGYIMAKLEGNSPQSGAAGGTVTYHIGGYSGANTTLHQITIPLEPHADVRPGATPQITIKTDLAEWLDPNPIDFGITHTVTSPGTDAAMISENYSDMFSLENVSN